MSGGGPILPQPINIQQGAISRGPIGNQPLQTKPIRPRSVTKNGSDINVTDEKEVDAEPTTVVPKGLKEIKSPSYFEKASQIINYLISLLKSAFSSPAQQPTKDVRDPSLSITYVDKRIFSDPAPQPMPAPQPIKDVSDPSLSITHVDTGATAIETRQTAALLVKSITDPILAIINDKIDGKTVADLNQLSTDLDKAMRDKTRILNPVGENESLPPDVKNMVEDEIKPTITKALEFKTRVDLRKGTQESKELLLESITAPDLKGKTVEELTQLIHTDVKEKFINYKKCYLAESESKTNHELIKKEYDEILKKVREFQKAVAAAIETKNAAIETKNTAAPIVNPQDLTKETRDIAALIVKRITDPILEIINKIDGKTVLEGETVLEGKTVAELKQLRKDLDTAMEEKRKLTTETSLSTEVKEMVNDEIKPIIDLVREVNLQVRLTALKTICEEVPTRPLAELKIYTSALIEKDMKSLGCYSENNLKHVEKLKEEAIRAKGVFAKAGSYIVAAQKAVRQTGWSAPQPKLNKDELLKMITDPILKITTAPKMEDKSMEELKTINNSLKKAMIACVKKNLDALAQTHGLSPEDSNFLNEEIKKIIKAQVEPCKLELAAQAPKTMMREVVEKPFSELQKINSSNVKSELKAMACSKEDMHQVDTHIAGLKHMGRALGEGASQVSLKGVPYTGSPTTVSENMYGAIPKETRTALATLYSDGTLSADKETSRFFRQAGVCMQISDVADFAANIVKGDHKTLMAIQQRPPDTSDVIKIKFHSFESIPVNLALHGATTPEGKSRVLVQHGLQTTINRLADSMTLKGTDGQTTKINTTAFKFDARTVTSLLNCAKPDDKKQFDLLFASAMILQHKLDNNAPINAPVSPEFRQELYDVLGVTDSQEILSLVEKGFEGESAVNHTLSFMTSFAQRLGTRDDIQKTMLALVDRPMEAIIEFQAAIAKSGLGIGGMDANQAAAITQGLVEKHNSTLSGVDLSGAGKGSNDQDTVAPPFFDVHKSSASHKDFASTIQDYDSQLSQIDAELSALPTTPLPKGIEIQHVRHVVNADLAKQDVATLTSGTKFAALTKDMPHVSLDALSEKLNFATMPTSNMFGPKPVYNFKQDDMPSTIKTEVKDGKTFLALYEHQPGTSGDSGKLMGYLDPANHKGFIAGYIKNAKASIAHADNASHSATVRSMMSEPNAKESVIRKDVLTDAKTAITEARTEAVKEHKGNVDLLAVPKRSVLQKIKEAPSKIETRIYDFRNNIGNNQNRINVLAEENESLVKSLEDIDRCDKKLAEIDAELVGLGEKGVLPDDIKIQHVRHVVNADLARQEVLMLDNEILRPNGYTFESDYFTSFSNPTGMPHVSEKALATKLSFATMPTSNTFGRQSVYNFKKENMPSILKVEKKDGEKYLALYEHQPGTSGDGDGGKLIGYLLPERDRGFIDNYIKNANASIAHEETSKHSEKVRRMMSEPNAKESVIRKDVLPDARTAITNERTAAVQEKETREAQITKLISTGSTAFKSNTKAVRVAISEYCREQLGTVSGPEMTQKMDEIVQSLNANDQDALTAITGKLVSAEKESLASLIQTEARSFKGIESFQDWQKSYTVTGTIAKKDLARAEEVRGSAFYQQMKAEKAAGDLINGLKSTGDNISLSFGKLINVSTAKFSRGATATLTGGVAQLSASGSRENSDDIRLVKTEKGYQIQLESRQLITLGLESIFAEIATVDVTGGASTSVGYHLDFDSAEKASQFLCAVTSGDTESLKDKSCLGLPSSVCGSSRFKLYGGVSAGCRIAPPIPGLSSELNMGTIDFAVSGEREVKTVGNTTSTTTAFSGSFNYSFEAIGELAAMAIGETSEGTPPAKAEEGSAAGDLPATETPEGTPPPRQMLRRQPPQPKSPLRKKRRRRHRKREFLQEKRP